MKILRIRADGLPLYNEPFDINLYAVQRVERSHIDAVHNIFGNIYINTGVAFIGINASGKTSALKVISFATMLLSAAPLNAEYVPKILGIDKKTTFDIDFFCDGKINHLTTSVIQQKKDDGQFVIKIISEKLWEKKSLTKINKANLLCYENLEPVRVRNIIEQYLPDDVSIMIAVNKQNNDDTLFIDLAMFTNFNLFLPTVDSVEKEILSLLDSKIEKISVESVNNKSIAHLKFYGQEEMVLLNPSLLMAYLSSGTVKGIRVFTDAVRVLKNGGYLLVDEIENHFNRELVVSLLRLFMSKKTNPKGAVILFSTHYPDLLDEMGRNDSVFITRSNEGLRIDNLNNLLKRNDMKKSEVYQSNFLGGTAPAYKKILALQKNIRDNLEA